jgi:hydroxymethylglutaryl-CoA reductase (NADPH)
VSFFSGVLKQLYTTGSLANTGDGFRFELKNRLMAAKLHGVRRVTVDGRDVSLDGAEIAADDGRVLRPGDVSAESPADFDVGDRLEVRLRGGPLAPGAHALVIEFDAQPVGRLTLEVEDVIAA